MKYELEQMEIVTFKKYIDNEKYSNNKKIITLERNEDYISKKCLVDYKNNKAYNIYNLDEVYPILYRNENGLLEKNQNIKANIAYAIKEELLNHELKQFRGKRKLKNLLSKLK